MDTYTYGGILSSKNIEIMNMRHILGRLSESRIDSRGMLVVLMIKFISSVFLTGRVLLDCIFNIKAS